MSDTSPLFLLGVFLVALAYSSVGHGGASGYLAIMAFTPIARKDAAIIALAMNVMVSAISFIAFRRAKVFNPTFTWPILLGSVPMAFLGGRLKLSDSVHGWILAAALVYGAVMLWIQRDASGESNDPKLTPSPGTRIGIGAGIGLLSGMVGVGGGIFLSPILILSKWLNAKSAAATAAIFIFANSVAGLTARAGTAPNLLAEHWPALFPGVIGACLGAWVGANRIQNLALRRILSVVMVFAVIKLVLK